MHEWGSRLARAAARINAAAGFTAGEQRLVLFLAAAFVAGFLLKLAGVGERPAAAVDYRQLDSVFAARSALLVPAAGEGSGAQPAADSGRRPAKGGLVDLNRAGKNELMALPGIGPTLAERIVNHRSAAGRFRTVDDLLNVRGIGRKKLELLAPLCTVSE